MPVITNLNINADAGDILKTVLGMVPSRESYNDQWKHNGDARWISYQTGGMVVSAYFHKTKFHYATVQTGLVWKREAKSSAPAGQWAVASINSIMGGDRTYYDEDD